MNNISYFHRQMQQVKDDILTMAGLVEQSIHDAAEAMARRDPVLALAVIKGDRRIDIMQNQIEERCITLLATQQPVAVDLRFLSAVIKICAYLERMGDQAVNLAQRSQTLEELLHTDVPATLLTMAEIAQEMTRGCMDAFAAGDVLLANGIIKRDDDLDSLNRHILEEMVQWMASENRLLRRGVEFILSGRHLERIGDEATNIAEEVVYLVEGRVIRHLGRDPEASVGPL
ncbi:MAG: phosphate signaling complex protein PhoU [Pseudomonadota bacterium]